MPTLSVLESQRIKGVFRTFLSDVRWAVQKLRMDVDRLPRWVRVADVRIGYHERNVFAVVDDGLGRDRFTLREPVHSDIAILLDTPDFSPEGWTQEAIFSDVFVDMTSAVMSGDDRVGRIIMEFSSDRPAFMPIIYEHVYNPAMILGAFFSHNPARNVNAPTRIRYVPLAIYLHDDGSETALHEFGAFQMLIKCLKDIHDSSMGEFYRRWNQRDTGPSYYHRTGVLVLGAYREQALANLRSVRDFVRSLKMSPTDHQEQSLLYNGDLVLDIPDLLEDQSNEQKVRMWALMARFVILVDDVPSGAIAEYAFLRQDRVIVALLRPRSGGSTGMIGDEPLTDINYIRAFEYEESPLEVVADAVLWAEEFVQARAAAYNDAYKHRGDA